MPTDDETLAARDRAATRLMALPNVTTVGIGGRVRGGERINELVLKVYVSRKLPPHQIDPAAMIPAEIEGLPTDVVEMLAEGHSVQAPPGREEVPISGLDGRRQRPLVGGSQMQPDLPGAGFGTLGCMAVDRNDETKAYALTNWHVLLGGHNEAPTNGSTKSGQPTNSDSVTKCCSDIIGKVAGGNRDGVFDAGVVQLNPGTKWTADILEIGPVANTRDLTTADVSSHLPVRKRGARSGLTGGTIDSMNVPLTVDGILYNDGIVITPNLNTALPAGTAYFFDQHGDSGSALVTDAKEVVGLVFAIPNAPPGGYTGAVAGWALPIKAITDGLAALGVPVQIATAASPHVVNTVPGAALATVPEELTPALLGAPTPGHAPAAIPAAVGIADVPSPAALAQLERDLDRSERGRALITFWLNHQRELLELIGSNRRVATAWHRSGAAALFQVLTRMLSHPEITLPRTLNGQPPVTSLDRLTATLDRFASPALAGDLAHVRARLPEVGGLNYAGICSALASD